MADSPELAAAKRLLDLAKESGFRFWRTAPGADGPVWGERESLEWLDTTFLAGFSEGADAPIDVKPLMARLRVGR